MEMFIYPIIYIVGYCFSLGIMKSIWKVSFTYDAGLMGGVLLLMLIWPLWWVMYIPYRIAVYFFED